MPGTPAEGWGQECRWHSCSKALQPRSRRQGLGKSPASIGCAVQGAIGSGAALQENVICWENLGGRWPSLSLARGGMQEHGPARGGMPGRVPAIGDTRLRLSPSRECGRAPGRLWNSLGNGKTGISNQPGKADVSLPTASHRTTHGRAHETQIFNSPNQLSANYQFNLTPTRLLSPSSTGEWDALTNCMIKIIIERAE